MTPRFARMLTLLLLGCAAMPAGAAPARDRTAQLLVTLRMDATVHPGSYRDFRRPRHYGGGPHTDVLLDALARDHGLRRGEGWPIHALSVYCAVFEVPHAAATGPAVARLQADTRVESAQPLLLHRTRAAATPSRYDDPMLPLQTSFSALRLGAAHALSRGRGSTVAIVDSGLDRQHPELRGRIATHADFTGGEAAGPHGTAVAGLIAARADNGIGIVGVAPEARLLDLRACWPSAAGGLGSVCSSLSLARALDAAVSQQATVIALALAGPEDPLVARLIDAAVARGASVVAAAAGGQAFPASREDVVAAAASGAPVPRNGGRIVQVPAAVLITTFPGGGYDFVSGDSFAVAQVAGLIALMRARDPGLTPAAVRATLLRQQPLDAMALLQPAGPLLAAAR